MLTAKEMYETFHADDCVIPFENLSARTKDRWMALAAAAEADVAQAKKEEADERVENFRSALADMECYDHVRADDDDDNGAAETGRVRDRLREVLKQYLPKGGDSVLDLWLHLDTDNVLDLPVALRKVRQGCND